VQLAFGLVCGPRDSGPDERGQKLRRAWPGGDPLGRRRTLRLGDNVGHSATGPWCALASRRRKRCD